MADNVSKWKFAADRGGTFTDIVGVDPEGSFHTLKILSQSTEYEEASIEGIRRILGLNPRDPLPEDQIAGIRFGTTVATNALLQRSGGNTGLFITKGFRDLLEIGYQDRPGIFDLCINKPSPLHASVIEVSERVDCRGQVLRGLEPEGLLQGIGELKKSGADAAAVVFMHSWIHPGHELRCEELLREQGFTNVFLSHKTVNQIKIISRGQSALVDAYLSVVLAEYLEGIRKAVGRIPVSFMQSSGALSSGEAFKGRNALLSGPSGGALAVAALAGEMSLKGVIGFDMGGTSTDVCRFDGEFGKLYEQTVAGIPLQVEMMDIVTVAAGGGSILNFDGQRMTAGPGSAGSFPGPACYGFGGPLTITDANLVCGRLVPQSFPRVFGKKRNASLDREIAEKEFLLLADDINDAMGTSLSVQETAAGFLRIANEKMAMAIREISTSRGFDIRRDALVCFGGAGAQHACSIAALLDIRKIILHPLSGVMSAYGIGLARPAWKASRTMLSPYDSNHHGKLPGLFREMEREITASGGDFPEHYTIKRELELRPRGAETALTIRFGAYEETVSLFKERYRTLFGFDPADVPLEIVNIKIDLEQSCGFIGPCSEQAISVGHITAPSCFQDVYCSSGSVRAPVYSRKSLPPQVTIPGPAIIADSQFTIVVEPGFDAVSDKSGIITINQVSQPPDLQGLQSGRPDPVLLEVFNNLFMGVAVEMGLILKNTAHSVNMKERLDYSCALFDSAGDLVANAPHIPVHLGSMADTVKAVISDRSTEMKPGDAYLTNNPYRGGSHLSDMTIICPVFSPAGKPVFFTAARGHHADVGGQSPGSMPPSAVHIDEEGVLIDNFLLLRDGMFREEQVKELLTGHRFPARNIPERIADFRAQVAACRKGIRELTRVIERYGLKVVLDYMHFIQANAEYSVKKALSRFVGGRESFSSSFEDFLDDGTPVRTSVRIDGGADPPHTLRAVIDFSGTGGEHGSDNLNAPSSVAVSAILYVLRSLIQKNIPLNSGCLKPVTIVIPAKTILSPEYPRPVASGNVETSQRVVDVLLGAMGITAASQGTMNNLLFEVEGESPYYETIAGGAGAMEGCPGASGVQVHMTNTRMTDPEVLEVRHSGVRLEQFTLRKGSGGGGRFPGGDGVVREITFLKPATVSIISERRNRSPYGARGGKAGKKGKNLLKRAGREFEELRHREILTLGKNDSIIIKTPGGGGFGKEE